MAQADYHDRIRSDALGMLEGDAGRVLDFGGGTGATSAQLKRQGRASQIVLFDLVAGDASDAIDTAEAIDLNDQVTLTQLLTSHGPFDTILCLDVLEHLIDPWGCFALLERSLQRGGTMVVSLPNASHHSLLGGLILRGRFRYQDAGIMDRTHLRWFGRADMVDLATSGGLKIIAVEPNISGRRDNWLNHLTLRVFERFLAKQYRLKLIKPED